MRTTSPSAPILMPRCRLKFIYFAVAGINSFATTYFFFYLFFYLHDHFRFGNAQNLAVCAGHGFIYTFSAWFGGRFSQRAGYFVALPLGLGLMTAALLTAHFSDSIGGLLGSLAGWTFGVCFTWPTLEALACEGESSLRLQRMVGIYNLVWAGTAAIAYFVGGALKELLGDRSIFWLPAILHTLQLGLVFWVKRRASAGVAAANGIAAGREEPQPQHPTRPGLPPKSFLMMAWLANPFAYVAMNAAVPVIPVLAERLHLNAREAGFFCSFWFFARLATFAWLWRWTGWHYRFQWLLGAYVLMVFCFAAMLLSPCLLIIGMAQLGFGFGVGLIYYSSLFYSMEVGETKGEHGGIHEAMIGSGVFGGAAIGSAGQYLLGGQSSSTWVVSTVLIVGLACLLGMRRRFKSR